MRHIFALASDKATPCNLPLNNGGFSYPNNCAVVAIPQVMRGNELPPPKFIYTTSRLQRPP